MCVKVCVYCAGEREFCAQLWKKLQRAEERTFTTTVFSEFLSRKIVVAVICLDCSSHTLPSKSTVDVNDARLEC